MAAFFSISHLLLSTMKESEAFAILNAFPGLGAVKIRLLVERFGTAAAAINANAKDLDGLAGFEKIALRWGQWDKFTAWKQDLSLAEAHGAAIIPYTDPLFPKHLLEIADHPVLLYIKGELKPQDQRSIAIVGTRQASIYGIEMAEAIGKELAAAGFTVISGLARGIDTAAHKGALQRGRTAAVIGSGLADIYPPENQSLANKIPDHGALISEFAMATPPDRHNFPQRNRIVSGLTLGTVLIEAPIKSGAMITMERAIQQKRKLFALPGRADAESFKGNHLLIKRGQAQLVENSGDILAHFEGLFPKVQKDLFDSQAFHLDAGEKALLDLMPSEEIGIDALALLTHLPVHQVLTTLMGLVLKRAVKEYPGKIYKKLAALNDGKSHNWG